MATKLEKIHCPTCQKLGTWKSDNRFRPFCSERCKLIDLGEWADEAHKLPGDPARSDTLNDEHDQNNL